MAKNSNRPPKSTPKSLSRISPFGPPPLLEGEDSLAYDELLARVSGDIKPTDFVEEIWIRDVVDLTWEIFRWRRLTTSLLTATMLYDLKSILVPLVRPQSAGTEKTKGFPGLITNFEPRPPSPEQILAENMVKNLVKKWAMRDPAAIERVDKLLESVNTTTNTVMAGAFVQKLEDIERIDRLITIAEARRNAAFREIGRHREPFAQTLRGTIKEIEATEFETVKPSLIAPKSAANKNAA
jgi:hypothetical protein